jgi:hypothetical protein
MKVPHVKTLGVCILTCFTCSSCFFGSYIDPSNVPLDRQMENTYYIPSSSNIPSLYKKNDLTVSINSSFGSKIERAEAYAAYAPLKNLGIFASYAGGNKDGKVKLSEASLALGYWRPLSTYWHFQTYGGIDNGNIQNTHYTGTSKINITRLFLQPSVSVRNLKNTVEFAFVTRLTTAHFKVLDTLFNQSGERFSSDQLKNLGANPNHLFLEPGMSLRFGWQSVLFNLNYTSSALIAGSNFYRSTYCFSLGASFQINVAKKNVSFR